jgi:hypothetical protein
MSVTLSSQMARACIFGISRERDRALKTSALSAMCALLPMHAVAPLCPAMRAAASSLVVKAANVASRLQTACRDVEYAAAACLTIQHVGTTEREAIIQALHDDMSRRDADVHAAPCHLTSPPDHTLVRPRHPYTAASCSCVLSCVHVNACCVALTWCSCADVACWARYGAYTGRGRRQAYQRHSRR